MGKIGVYLCKCGGNISDNVNFDAIVQTAQTLPNVSVVRVHDLLCGKEGQDMIAKDIRDGVIDRVLTIACSPKLHSKTFLSVCSRENLNPYMLHMVNIREQGTWMTPDKDKVSEKIIRMLRAGVARIDLHEVLPQKEIDISPDVLVIGSGIAGVEAALQLAHAGRKVYVIEKEAAFGGWLPRFEHTFPNGECAPCILAPRIKELLDNESLKLLPNTVLKDVVGFGGNFTATITKKPRYVVSENCISCMMCILECPVEAKNPFNLKMDTRKAIDFPFLGCAPKAPHVDASLCKRFKGEACDACQKACEFGAVDFNQKEEEITVNVGAVIIAIGAQEYDKAKVYPGVTGENDNVFTGVEFERILSATGPTKSKVLTRSGQEPKTIAVVHCVGSRNPKHLNYCSGVCCKAALKHSEAIKHKAPGCKVVHIFNDLCIEGPHMQHMLDKLNHEGVNFWRWLFSNDGKLAEIQKQGDKYLLTGTGFDGKSATLEADLVVLETGLQPNKDISELVEKLSLTEHAGFVVPVHEKINSVTCADGVYVVGMANSPKDVTASVVEAKAAVAEILATYIPGRKLKLEPAVAESDAELCGSCKTCIALCPYHAPYYDEEKKTVVVSDVLCKGCGTCVAACPTGAMKAKHFTSSQIIKEIEGVLK